ncbi:MAG: ABC transporter permease [Deinococcales bacterium]
MRFHFVWQVALKELVSTVRDSKAFRASIILPFVMTPLFIIGFPLLFGNLFGGEAEKKQIVGVENLAQMPSELKTLLEQGVELRDIKQPLEAVQNDDVDAALSIPATGVPKTAGAAPVNIQVFVKLSNQRASVVRSKLIGAIEQYSKSLVLQKLASVGLSPDTLEPVRAQVVNAETVEERSGGAFAFLFPMFIFLAILGGASTVAVDSTAGEKERGSLEILLVSPVRRLEVVLGKLLAVTLFALFGVAMQVLAFVVSGALSPIILGQFGSGGGREIASLFGGNLQLGFSGFFSMLLIGITVALMLSGLLVAICIYARSFKEAQTYLVPLQLVAQFVSIGMQFGDFISRSTLLYATPVIGSTLGILDIVKGKATSEIVAVIVVANLVFATGTAYLALRNFSREQVLFRN